MVEYVVQNGSDLRFTKYFWRGCEPLPIDISQYSKFVEVLKMHESGVSRSDIHLRTQVKQSTVYAWTLMSCMPKLAHFLKALRLLGEPTPERVWLTLEQSHGHALPIGRFIQVPSTVGAWSEVEAIINQTIPTVPTIQDFDSRYLFGFLSRNDYRRQCSQAQARKRSQAYWACPEQEIPDEPAFGRLSPVYAPSIFGLRMGRKKDQVQPPGKPNGFYEWASQSSPFVDWIYHVALGLAEGELTTYDPIHLDWAIDSPIEFRTGLIQGIAESDGSVSIASQAVEFWVIPNWDFLMRLLATFGLHGFRNREAFRLVEQEPGDFCPSMYRCSPSICKRSGTKD